MKKSFIIPSMAAFAALCFSLTAQAQGPVVVSDKDDYAPGETAMFSAAGFQPNELLDFSVAISDENGQWIPDIAWADVPADASGGAEVDYVVPQTWADKSLQLTVMGLSSGLMATTMFTDHVPHPVWTGSFTTSGLVPPTLITISGSRNSPGGTHAQTAYSVMFTSPAVSAGTGSASTDPGTSFTGTWTYSGFPASVPGVGGTYDLVSVTDPSGTTACSGGACFPKSFTTPTGAGSGTITGNYTFTATPPANMPPVVTPVSEVHVPLGQIVGCLDGDGGFDTSVDVEYSVEQVNANNFNVNATFNGGNQTLIGTVNDPDGNLQLANIVLTPDSQTLTFTGPGTDTQSFSTSVTATDDASASDTETCPTVGDATVQIVYNFNGFFSPLSNVATTKVKRGSGVPVKFSITDCSGNQITAGDHTIDIVFVSGVVPTGDPTVDDAGMSGDNGINFRYDPTGMQWIFNLKTNTSYGVGNTYKIVATLDDETTHEALISIK